MLNGAPSDRVRTAEIIAALSLATDLAVGFPMEHGLRSAHVAMRLCDRLGADDETASQTYFLSLLFYVGCTSPVDVGWEVFGNDHSFHTNSSEVTVPPPVPWQMAARPLVPPRRRRA